MNLLSAILFAVLAGSFFLTRTDCNNRNSGPPARGSNVPRFFEFDKFVQLYNKHYASFVERLNRMRLFMAKATVIFHRGVQYIHREVGHYLAFNDKSDWTDDERARLYPKADDLCLALTIKSREETDKILDEILKDNESIRVRQIRSASAPEAASERHLSFDQLLKDPNVAETDISPKMVASIPSNNPDYEEPDLMSEGVDDDSNIEPSLSADDAVIIQENSPDVNLVSDALKSFTNLLSAAGVQSESKGKIINKVELTTNTDDSARRTQVYSDYRDTNCLAPVKNQFKCGSCYAFSTMAVYEYLHCRQTGKLVSFSEQFLIDCGQGFDLKGCHGGTVKDSADFVAAIGLELASYYPYRARSGKCPYGSEDYAKMGHTRVKNHQITSLFMSMVDNNQLVQLLETFGPLVLGVHTSADFADYGGGVHRLRNPNFTKGHAMALVGHGIQEGEEYWLLRNSLGADWGEAGYYKLSKHYANPKAMMFTSYIRAEFDQNRQHSAEKVRKNVGKNRKLIERLFNL